MGIQMALGTLMPQNMRIKINQTIFKQQSIKSKKNDHQSIYQVDGHFYVLSEAMRVYVKIRVEFLKECSYERYSC